MTLPAVSALLRVPFVTKVDSFCSSFRVLFLLCVCVCDLFLFLQTLVTPPRCVSALLRVPFSLRYIVVVLHSQHTHTSALLRIPFVTIAGSFSSSFQTLVTPPRCVSARLRVPLSLW